MFKKRNQNQVSYHEELGFYARQLAKINFSQIYNWKFKKWIFKKLTSQDTTKNVRHNINHYLTNDDLSKIKKIQDIKLKSSIDNWRILKDIKKSIEVEKVFEKNKILLNKELVSKQKLLDKKIHIQKNYKSNKKTLTRSYKRNEINVIRLQTRIKDLKEFIRNKSIYTKVFVADEKPLNYTGWIKILLSYGLILFWAAIILWPIFELIKATLNNDATRYLNSSSYTFGFDAFRRLFVKTRFKSWLINTLWIAGASSGITVFTTLLMGYAFSRFRFRGKKTSLLATMLIQMIPSLSALTVFYVIYTILHQSIGISGHLILIIIYAGGGIAGNTFIMKGYMDSISLEIDEAATIDGLSKWQIFSRIIVPLTKPMIALVALWSFIGPFGDYILPGLLLSKPEEFTLAKGLRSLITDPRSLDQAAFAAGSMIVAIPISILFISLRKFLISGLTAGGVKG